MTNRQPQLSPSDRFISGFLALVWLGVGIAAAFVAIRTSHWSLGVGGLASVWFGLAWARVTYLKRKLTARQALLLWRAADD